VWDRRGNPERAGKLEPETRPLTTGGSMDFTKIIADDCCEEIATCGTGLQTTTEQITVEIATCKQTRVLLEASRAACGSLQQSGVGQGRPPENHHVTHTEDDGDVGGSEQGRPPEDHHVTHIDGDDDHGGSEHGRPPEDHHVTHISDEDSAEDESTGPPWASSDGDGDSADDRSTRPPAACSDSDGDSVLDSAPDTGPPAASRDDTVVLASEQEATCGSLPELDDGDAEPKRWADFDSCSETYSEESFRGHTSDVAGVIQMAIDIRNDRQAYIDGGGVDSACLLSFENSRQALLATLAWLDSM
jgi:hypothetical protein